MLEDTKVICNRSEIVTIADKVRNKTGIQTGLTLEEIAQGVDSI
jgi:hypothetical protein